MADVKNKIIRGTFGRLFVNGQPLANVKSFEIKATVNYETVNINGEPENGTVAITKAANGDMTAEFTKAGA